MKYTLAIEASTASPSAALLRDEETLGEASWRSTRGSSQHMFQALDGLLKSNDVTLEAVDLFAVGLGPGGFTGLRLALSALQALALPTHAKVVGISSAEAVAVRVQHDAPPAGRILVVGDARRARLWVGVFSTEQGKLRRDGDFALVPLSDFPGVLHAGDTVVSPDRARLGDALRAVVPAAATLIETDVIPTARDVALLARQRDAAGIAGEPLEPIYMHPPVFIEPRFTEARPILANVPRIARDVRVGGRA